MRMNTGRGLAVAMLGAAALVGAGCGSGSDDTSATGTSASSGASTTADAGGSGGGAGEGLRVVATDYVPEVEGAATFETPEPGSGDGLKIGYISYGEAVPFVKLVSDSLKREADTAGAELLMCDSQLDAAKALDCAKNLKTQQVDVVVNFQGNQKAAGQICAAGPDVPTLAIDVLQEPCMAAFMGADNLRAGRILGDAVGEFAKSEFDCDVDAVVIITVTAAGDVTAAREQGAREGYTAACGDDQDIRVVDTQGTTESGQKVFTDTLTALSGRERIMVMSLSDDMAVGALAAAKAQGREEHVWIGADGGDPTVACEIQNNDHYIGDTAYFPQHYGEIAIPNAIRLANGEEVPEELLIPHVFIDSENLSEYYEVSGCE